MQEKFTICGGNYNNMALESVINLGIKGSELVATKLKDLQKQKANLSKKSDVSLGSKIQARRTERKVERESGIKLSTKSERDSIRASNVNVESNKTEIEKPKSEERKPGAYETQVREGFANAKSQAASSVISMDGGNLAKAGMGAVASLIPVIGSQVADALNFAVDAMKAFKDKIKQQAQIVADTQAQVNTITNSFKKNVKSKTFEDFIGFDVKDAKGKVTRQGRSDLTKSDQAAIIKSISSSMGKVSDEFGKSVSKLFISENGKTKYDVEQSTALAQGNFSALGNDKGFFMQQISNGFSGLPPSMKQALTSQMFNMLEPGERDVQNNYGIKSTVAGFDARNRNKAAAGLDSGKGAEANIKNAMFIEDTIDKLDLKLQSTVGSLTDRVVKIADAKDPMTEMKRQGKEILTGAAQAAADAVKAGSDAAVAAIGAQKDAVVQSMAEIGTSIKGKLSGLNPFN